MEKGRRMSQPAMSRRSFLRASAAGGLAAWAASAARTAGAAGSGGRPNIVLIMADDLGYETIGANGGTSYATPVLDGMARGGVRFEHCYAQPLCTPSRVKIMTGIYNVRNYVRFGVLDPEQTTFANLLKRDGYATCVVGKWQLEGGFDGPHRFGFDEYCLWQLNRRPGRYPNPGLEVNGKRVDYTDGEYGPDVVSDFACDFIRRHRDGPFLVYYPMILTHCPFEPTPDSPDWDPASKGSKTYKGDAKYFGDMVTYMDKIVGKFLRTLEEAGVRENTLVLFTGDNGTDRPVVSEMDGRKVAGAKGSTTDAGTRVPLIVDWPAQGASGRVCRDLVDFSDFLPTLCEAAGVGVPEALAIDGRSFLPQIKGREGNPRDWIYCWYSRSGKSKKAKVFARTRRYKLYASGTFYDVAEDPLEKHPLGDKAADLSDEAERARAMLEGVLKRYADARPDGLG
jgi:arylsulfatase A